MRNTPLVFVTLLVLSLAFSSGPAQPPERFEGRSESGETPQVTLTAVSYTPHSPITISSNEDFLSQGWPGDGTSADPYLIENLNIRSLETCINVSDTTVFFEISNCRVSSFISKSNTGIWLDNVTHCSIHDCVLVENGRGIILYSSANCSLTRNAATKNTYSGFVLSFSEGCRLTNNNATRNIGFGGHPSYNSLMWNISIENKNAGFSVYSSENCTLISNIAANNTDSGFYFGNSTGCTLTSNTATGNTYEGFFLWQTVNSTMTSNTATGNKYDGFFLSFSYYCMLTRNNAMGNAHYGFYLSDSWVCKLFLNRIGPNGRANALDYGMDNTWDDGVSLGNYWSDYSGIGVYPIMGMGNSEDRFPLSDTLRWGHTVLLVATVGAVTVLIALLVLFRNRQARGKETRQERADGSGLAGQNLGRWNFRQYMSPKT